MVYYRGRLIDVDTDLLNRHTACYGGPPEEWRYDNYICVTYKIHEQEIDDILPKLSDVELSDLFSKGLDAEASLLEAPVDNVLSICSHAEDGRLCPDTKVLFW